MSMPLVNFHFEEVEIADFEAEELSKWITETIRLEQKEVGEINYIF